MNMMGSCSFYGCRGVVVAAAALLLLAPLQPLAVQADCIYSNQTLNDVIAGSDGRSIPTPGSCCMQDVCGLACPLPVPPPGPGYGDAIIVIMVLSALVGIFSYFFVNGEATNYFVAARSLSLWVVAVSLAVQSLDYSSLLGNADSSYKFSFYDGAVFPIGLGLALILNGVFLAHHIQQDEALTLVDVYAKRYGRTVEVLASVATVISLLMLSAGNLKAIGVLAAYLWSISEVQAVWVGAIVIWAYTECGGLYSVVYTGIFQAAVGWLGVIVMAFWFIANEQDAPAPSIGYPGYIYPDNVGDGGPCDLYNGTQCQYSTDQCCYNTELWCPGYPNVPCTKYDRGAYPMGDQQIYHNQMTSATALDPYPNAILWNWATIFILAIGNLAALDFQARCIASDSGRNARIACIVAGLLTLFIGIPFSYLGSITRVYYGPDSVHSTFEADSCSAHLGAPTCGLWIPDHQAFVKLLVNQAPAFLGGWCLIGIVAASMSTASGAILAMGTVVSNNLVRQFVSWLPHLVTHDNLLLVARVSTLPVTITSACIAAYYSSAGSSTGGIGYLLIIAFDVVLASVVVPLFGCFYTKHPSPRAALLAILGGASTRIALEFTLPKDGTLVVPYDSPAFLNFGTAASALLPSFVDGANQTHWDPAVEPCYQEPYQDYTGVDSLGSLLVCLVVFVTVQFLEHKWKRPLFHFPGDQGYIKSTSEHPLKHLEAGAVGLPWFIEDSSSYDDDGDGNYNDGDTAITSSETKVRFASVAPSVAAANAPSAPPTPTPEATTTTTAEK